MSKPFTKNHLPVFPLNTVIFINGTLQLKIFEQRYLNMIKTCMQNQHGFISVLIREGKEVADIPEIYTTGTYVNIIDWNTLDNNLLAITIQGHQRVQINKTHVQDDNLISAEIDYLENLKLNEADIIDDDLLALLQSLQSHPFVAAKYPDIDIHDILDIAYKLSELLPIASPIKQSLLEASQTRILIDMLKTIISQLENLSVNTDLP
ncbi:MAG: LON peptidase substrate-binding domain-containing protein [Gammaproteobacteria bacterium]|nr:LON peptidase substrate-binding domain-containing protein [Gammaproteobacteria bacterium]MCW8924493.1 LON peptidase substrate-binding domain-containing protein [Gammaproteobacteria bacterium]